jgi:hypothetical protein
MVEELEVGIRKGNNANRNNLKINLAFIACVELFVLACRLRWQAALARRTSHASASAVPHVFDGDVFLLLLVGEADALGRTDPNRSRCRRPSALAPGRSSVLAGGTSLAASWLAAPPEPEGTDWPWPWPPCWRRTSWRFWAPGP